MNTRNLKILKKALKDKVIGIALIKVMMLCYILKKSNIKYPLYKDELFKVNDYINELTRLVLSNKEDILPNVDFTLYTLIDEITLIKQYDYQNLEECLLILDEETSENIKDFIINDVNTLNDKEDDSSPSQICELAINLLYKNDNQKWFNLGCGNGNFLINLAKKYKFDKCCGDDIDNSCIFITKLRLCLLKANGCIDNRDSLLSKYDQIADVAYAHIPLILRLSKDIRLYNMCNKYISNLKSLQNADWVFVDRLLQLIGDRAVILMSDGSLMNLQDLEQRKTIIDENFIEGIIKLPTDVFSYTGIPVSMVILNKNKKDTNVKFLDASKMCISGRRQSEIKQDEIYNAYINNEHTLIVSNDKIKESQYSLNINLYNKNINIKNGVVLENLVEEIYRGTQIPASIIDEYSKIEEHDNVYKLLSVGDIQDGIVDKSSLQTIKDTGRYERYLIKNNDILVSSKSTKIKVGRVEIVENEKIVATGSILVIRCDEKKLNPIYLKTFLDSKEGTKLLESIQTGTAILSINASALLKIKIHYESMEKQKEIADKYIKMVKQFEKAKQEVRKLEKELVNIFDTNI